MRRPGAAAGVVLSLSLVVFHGAGVARAVDFNRDVRPILSETCFQCHGPDKGKRKADLRLDTKEGAFSDPDRIVPGKPLESELLARLVSDDPDEKMPPPDSGRSLSKAQIEVIRQWIAEGAEWKGHWAFLPPARIPAPAPAGAPAGFVRNDIDRYVFARIAARGLNPSPEADRITLIRRLSFDLTGLPPTPAAVDAFNNDASPRAYEALVDRLLSSPHYGERMAAHWLDLVRYADTTGYHGDNHRDVTLYRDYVIDAFNRNVPFDRFTTEQFAGDLLPGGEERARIASGYNKLLMTTQEGGAQAKEYLAKYAADRVRNASTVWMGATLGCAECHDHKFDPYTARDFYRFAAFFADIKDVAVGAQPETKIPTPEQAEKARAIDAEIASLTRLLDSPTPELAAAQAAWEQSPGAADPEWTTLNPESARSAEGATLTIRDDGSILASGKNPDKDTYTITVKTPRSGLSALRLEVVADGKLPALGPGRASNGNFVLSELDVKTETGPLAWSNMTATHSQAGFPVGHSADGKLDTGWAILPENGRPNLAIYELKGDVIPGDRPLNVTLRFQYGGSHTLGRFRLSATDASRPIRATSRPREIADALRIPPGERTEAQNTALAAFYRSIARELDPTRAKLAEVKQARTTLEAAMPTTLVTLTGPPRTMRILPRGNWLDDSGEIVTPSVPAFLSPSFNKPDDGRANRLDLAKWVVSKDNPLTARVYVNRLWALFFGQGIVTTLDDFGSQGAWPTHPELLDHLAIEFVENGWDVKHMVRLIVTSGTYRQSSHAPESLRQKDPYNQWLARQGRFRLDAESVRDNALAVSGLLVEEVGGPNARPYQPAGYWSHLNFPKREYQPDHGDGLYRRGLYTYWCRTFLHPSLLAFDAPTREECTVQRNRSNTPLQALVLLNDPIYVEAARALAERILREPGETPASRFDGIYRAVLSRKPRPEEITVLADLLKKHRAEYRNDRDSALALIQTGERPVPADLDPAELAAWTSIARVVLNLHETITRN